jgi:hypothetical protein
LSGYPKFTPRDYRNVNLLSDPPKSADRSGVGAKKAPAPGRAAGPAAKKARAAAERDAGPNHLLNALNVYYLRPPSATQAQWDTLVREALTCLSPEKREKFISPQSAPQVLRPIWWGLCGINGLADALIAAGGQRTEEGEKIVRRWVAFFEQKQDEAMKRAGSIANPAGPPFRYPGGPPHAVSLLGELKDWRLLPENKHAFEPFMEWVSFGFNWHSVTAVLLEFWNAPAVWLKRPRRCSYQSCRDRPYFIPQASASACKKSHDELARRARRSVRSKTGSAKR